MKKAESEKKVWRLQGLDVFSDEEYPMAGEFPTEEAAIQAAKERLKDFEKDQPSEQSGGQGNNGIQDRVFVIRPDGTKFRVFP